MKKQIISIYTAIILMAGFTACSNDFLDIKPEQNVADEDAITDVNTLKTAIMEFIVDCKAVIIMAGVCMLFLN